MEEIHLSAGEAIALKPMLNTNCGEKLSRLIF
jgi:hypothetical protein